VWPAELNSEGIRRIKEKKRVDRSIQRSSVFFTMSFFIVGKLDKFRNIYKTILKRIRNKQDKGI